MSDYIFLMESRLSPEELRVLGHISRIAHAEGLNLYLVGGAIRDLTFGQQVVRDLDFAVEGKPEKILRHLESPAAARAATRNSSPAPSETPTLEVANLSFNRRFEAAELTFTNGVRASLAMCRTERHTTPGRRPETSPGTIFDDLRRRDFSINAMAVSLHPNSRGLLLDPTNGAAEIERHEISVLHSRSFLEDPSRIFRLIRLGLRLGFHPEERTKQYLDRALQDGLWEELDPDEQGRELRAILQEENPARALKALADRGLLTGLDRKLARSRIPYDRLARVRSAVSTVASADPFLLYFYCVVEKLGRSQQRRLAKKVIAGNRDIDLVLGFERQGVKLERALASSKAALPSQAYTLLSRQPFPLLLFVRAFSSRAKVQNRIKNFLFKYPDIRAKLPRTELQTLGVKPGPKFEKILERVFFDQLDGKIKTRQHLSKALRSLAGIPEPAKPPKTHKAAGTRPPAPSRGNKKK